MTHASPSSNPEDRPALTQGWFGRNSQPPSAASSPPLTPLQPTGQYQCPVCRHGQIEAMVLMDAFACDFCRHIFTPNLKAQTLEVVDSVQPMTWRWTGQKWRQSRHLDRDLTVLVWGLGAVLILLPPGLVGLAGYVFPPLADSPGANVPIAWAGLTLLSHSLLAGWLVAEHYQFSAYVALKLQLRRQLQGSA